MHVCVVCLSGVFLFFVDGSRSRWIGVLSINN